MSEASSGGVAPSAPVSSSAPGSVPSAAQEVSVPNQEQTPQQRLKFKARVEGKDEDVELDEETVKRDYQKRRGADAKFREASQLMKDAGATKAEIEAFKKNPIKALQDAGANAAQIRAFAEEYLLNHIEYEQLSAEEKRARTAEERAAKLEAEAEERNKAEKDRKRADAEASAAQEIDNEIGEALKAMGRKPTPRLIARVAESLIADFEANMAPLIAEYGDDVPEHLISRMPRMKPDQAVKRVQQEYMQDIAEFLGSLSIEDVRQFLPKEILDGLRQAEVNAVLSQDPLGSRKPRTQEAAPAPSRDKSKRMSSNDFFKKLDQKWS